MGTVIQSATYKLNNVCNAGSLPQDKPGGLPSRRTRTTINYTVIITQYIGVVKTYKSIYSIPQGVDDCDVVVRYEAASDR